jgi:YidC/Oxa1 family membrane protein insertase
VDRRFLTWLLLTTALFFLFMSMRQPPPVEPIADQGVALEDEEPLLREPPPPRAVLDGVQPPVAKVDFPSEVLTLGSMDPATGYNLLVTLNSRGAAVERVELVQRLRRGGFRYRALEHDGGYLGHLGLVEASNGMRIRVVPEGSPAALASSADGPMGLKPDDVLLEVDGKSVDSSRALERILAGIKPGFEVAMRIERLVNGQPQQMSYRAIVSEPPLDLVRMRPFDSEFVEGNNQQPSLRTTLASIEGIKIPAEARNLPALRPIWEVDWETKPLAVAGGAGVEFRLPLDSYLANAARPAELDLVKRYRLLPAGPASDGYVLDLETVVENRGQSAVTVAVRQEGIAGLTLEGWWYSVKISQSFFTGAGYRDVAYANEYSSSHTLTTTRELYNHALKNPRQPGVIVLSETEAAEIRNLRYIGLDSQYFNASVLPHPDQPQSLTGLRQAGGIAVARVSDIAKAKAQATNTTFWFDTVEQTLEPNGGTHHQRYQVFLGPKDASLLAAHGLEDAIEYGWFPLIAKPLGYILHFFYSLFGNYGLAIILLTVCVRGAMFPLGRKAALNAQRMSELQPEMVKINEKYKDNMEKRAKAMQELYAKHNFKPLAGCLPMFIQIPIFIGLYRCLSVDISLRQAPLIPGISWCSNLAAPDQLLNWSGWMPEFIAGRGTGWLGPYFNLLPILTVVLFLVQQKVLMPKATDEQTRMTQNMMQFMTVFMGVLFFKVPAGLCIYFITSSLWSLVERKLIKRLAPPKASTSEGSAGGGDTAAPADSPPSKPARSNTPRRDRAATADKPKTRFQEMMEILEKPAVRSATQRSTRKDKRKRG